MAMGLALEERICNSNKKKRKYIIEHKLKSTEFEKCVALFVFCMTVHKRNSKLFYCSFSIHILYEDSEQWYDDRNGVWKVHCFHKFDFFCVELAGKHTHTHTCMCRVTHTLLSHKHSYANIISCNQIYQTRKHYQDAEEWMWCLLVEENVSMEKVNEHVLFTRAGTSYSV